MDSKNNITRRSALKYLGMGTLGAITIFNGVSCTKIDKDTLQNATLVVKRKCKVSEAMISLLGFGCMRFPLSDPADRTSIDVEHSTKMVDYAISKGVNFFDTA